MSKIKKYLEPYAKENNLLQLSLFYFSKRQPKETLVEWKDDKGSYSLMCVCKKGVPGGFEQDVFTAAMRIWVKQGMPSDPLEVSYSDIARELEVSPRDWNRRIKGALERLGLARYVFKECFIVSDEDGNDTISTSFSLFDHTMLFSKSKDKGKKRGKSKLAMADLIKKNLESKYYQYLDMAWYRALPSGLPRRLYEFLEKKRYLSRNDLFVIGEENICRWLPIDCYNPSVRRRTLSKTANSLIEQGYLKAYSFDKKKKQCYFSYAVGASPAKEETKVIEVKPEDVKVKEEKKDSGDLDKLAEMLKLKRVTKSTKKLLASYLSKESFAYVERNILYANEKAKSSYANYLSKCLENDYAEAWKEEKEEKQDTLFDLNEELKKKHEEEEDKKKREEELEKKRGEFLEKAIQLNEVFTNMALDSAEKEVENNPAKGFAIKPAYAEKILDIINSMGSQFPKEVLSMDVIKKLWSKQN